MVLADPEPVELGLGLGVVGSEGTGELLGGGDVGIGGGGLDGRVSGGDEKLPWREKGAGHRCRVIKIQIFNLMFYWELIRSHWIERSFGCMHDFKVRVKHIRCGGNPNPNPNPSLL